MKYGKNLKIQLETTSYEKFHSQFKELSSSHSCEAHKTLELDIVNSKTLSTTARVSLLSLLFITSLRFNVYHYKGLISRINSLVIPASEKQDIIATIKPLQHDSGYITEQIRTEIYSVFAAPSSSQKDLYNLATWIKSHPALLSDEQETLANTAELRGMILEMALQGDRCAMTELIESRNQWYLKQIASATDAHELETIKQLVNKEQLPQIWRTGLNNLVEYAEESLATSGCVDLGNCITKMIKTAVLACRMSVRMGETPDYSDYINSTMRWFSSFINSPMIRNMLELIAEKARDEIHTIQAPAFRTKSLLVYNH